MRGFTLVELLVVVAIISVLAALLMPTLADTLEQARRAMCMGNTRQLYFAAASYASDWNDALPYSCKPPYYDVRCGNGYTDYCAFGSPMRHFYRNYCSVNIPINSDFLRKQDSMVYCPSMRNFGTDGGYMYPGFGWYACGWTSGTNPVPDSVRAYGTTHLAALGSNGAGYPFARQGPIHLLGDNLNASATNGYANNHNMAGGNVTAGDGSCKWNGWDGFQQVSVWWRALGYYSQIVSHASPWNMGVYAPLTHAYATGSATSEQIQIANRRLYGYR